MEKYQKNAFRFYSTTVLATPVQMYIGISISMAEYYLAAFFKKFLKNLIITILDYP